MADSLKNRVLFLLQQDAKHLYNRITSRKDVYISEFSLKRTRDHFKEIFKCRYDAMLISDLKMLSVHTLKLIDEFYSLVDELYWYLLHTQDMTLKVEDTVNWHIKKIVELYRQLDVYLLAEYQEPDITKEEKREHV